MSFDRQPTVRVEVLLLSERAGCLHYRQLATPLEDGMHPDDAARSLSGLTGCMPGGLLHSTSWRIGATGLVLTYAALPDPHPALGTVPVHVDATASGGPLTPTPAQIDIDAVAAHACRHLALLAVTDSQATASMRAVPLLWELLTKLTPGAAGGLRAVALSEKDPQLVV